jgi:hypothetical protein
LAKKVSRIIRMAPKISHMNGVDVFLELRLIFSHSRNVPA